jgi:glycosyltransferase involved in cell wall biosynthesis
MMRILILTNLYPSPWLPNRAAFNRQQFRAIADSHAVHVIAPISWTDRARSKVKDDRASMLRDGMVVEHPLFVFTPGCLRSRHGEFYERSVRKTFDRAVETFRPDVVLAAWAYPDVYAAVELCRRFELPLVAKVHGSDVLLPARNSLRARQTSEALNAATAVITVSEHMRSAVCGMRVPAERVHVAYNGVDTSIFRPRATRPASPRPKLLFVGNLVKVKGIDVLLGACERLGEKQFDFECDVIGTGPLSQALSKRIAGSSLAGRVRLVGSKPLREIAAAYHAADLLVVPSRSEGVPNVILEARACGLPILATRVGGIPEVLNASSMVEPENEVSLADGIVRALATPQPATFPLRSWSDSANEVAEVLRSAVRSRRKAAA